MKRKTKFFVSSLLTIAAAGVVATSCFVAFRPKPIYPLDTYILRFTHKDKELTIDSQNKSNESKNKYVQTMIKKTRDILDWYETYYKKTYGQNFPGLTFDYTNLNASQSEGEKNFFVLLDRTLKAIDSRLGFNNIPRTPTSVQEGFYQKNTEMISFYWSPDFNAITTWLTYMFTDQFPIGNQWPKLYRLLQNPTEGWQQNLKQTLESKKLFYSPIEILNFSQNARAASTDTSSQFYTLLSNTIGTWVVNNSSLTIEPSKIEGDSQGIYDVAKNPGLGIQFVNWISSQITNIPFVEDGPNSSTPFLIRSGYFNPNNPNADYNFRDWYFNKSIINDNAQFRFWNKANPFDVNKTPFNPSFSNASSSAFFNSAWTGLTSWTTVSDYHEIRDPQTKVGPDYTFLVSTGSKTSIEELERSYNESEKSLTFKIRPIPWVDYTGNQINDDQGRPAFLSPADFTASIVSFIRSNQISLNSNSYFIDLISLDTDKTIKYQKNLERNISSSDEKEFTLYFKEKPDISMHSILDILQKQYFCAVPAFKQSVKNITEYDTFIKILNAKENKDKPNPYIKGEYYLDVNSATIDFYNFYGSGNPVLNSNSWKDYAFASPYYVSSIDQQQIVFNFNESYFNSFTQQELATKEYTAFRKNETINPSGENKNKETNVISKIPKLILKYAGSYSEILTYEQFKNNELDSSELSSAKLLEAKNQFPQDYRAQKIDKLNKSNLVSFNLQVFSKDSNGIILDTSEKPIIKQENGRNVLAYDIDKYGNYVFPKNITPKIKSNISQAYYDLIVRDFYTPIEAYDPSNDIYAASATIRETIANCINWVALKSVVFPGITKSIQYSFMPYGVYEIGNSPNYKKYWWLAANKTYMLNELSILDNMTYQKRKSGLMIWTYDELLNNSIKEEGK